MPYSKGVPVVSGEPVMTLVLGLVGAGVALLVAFGVHITPEQGAAIAGFAAAALGLGLYVRSKVTPTAKTNWRRHLKDGERGLTLLEVLVVLLAVVVVLMLAGVL